MVSGEAGIGKSALVEALSSEAKESGFRLLMGRAWEFADAPAYFPLKTGLRALGVTPAVTSASDADAFGLWEDVLEALARESEQAPILWVVEDVHAADTRTIDLLAFLAQPLRAVAALVVVTVRTGDVRAAGPSILRLTRLVRDGATVTLGPLGAEDVTALAAEVSGRALPTGSLEAWMSRTGGNPLFVVECARAVRGGRSLASALPETVVEMVAERLRALAPATCRFLEDGAVLGREFVAATVARMTDRLPSVVIDDLLPAIRAGLIEEHAPGRFRFTHALVRDAIEEGMTASERRAVHARAAALADLGDATDVVVERARHALAGMGVVAEKDAEALVARAVVALETEGARDRAFALFRHWLDARRTPANADLMLQAARLASAAGAHGEAEHAAEAAFALAKAENDPARIARAALARGASPRPGVRDSGHVRALEEAIAGLAPISEPRLLCRLRARLAAALQPAADPSIPVAIARDAVAEARAIGDPTVLCEVLVQAGSALTFFVDAAEASALALELLSVSLATGDMARALRAFSRLVVARLELGDFAAFDADADRMMAYVREAGHPSLTWRPLIVASMRALARGEFEESERFVAEVEQAALLLDDPALTLMLRGHKAYRTFAIDDPDAVRAAVAIDVPAFCAIAGDLGTPAIRAIFAVRMEDREAAAATLPGLRRYVRYMASDAALLGSVAEAFALVGTDDDREDCLVRLRPLADLHVTTTPIPHTYEGPMSRVIGLLEASLGRLEAADAQLEAARVMCRTHGFVPWVARLSLERGRVLVASGRASEARALFEEAASVAADLGMRGIEAKARAAIGGATREPPTRTATADDRSIVELTREGEVWRVSWGSRVVRVRDSRGVQLLARLVASPAERIHVLALASDGDGVLPETDAGDVSDRRAVAAYRARLVTLDDDIAAADARTDRRHADALRRERALLLAEISRAIGLGGRFRKVGSATERARVAATRRLKDAVARISEADSAIGAHLKGELRTGTYCVYGKS